MSVGLSLFLLAVSFGLILAAAELFTNGIEWFGKKLQLAEGAVGSVLAAVGTALPETSIAIVAILSGEKSRDVGIGAILGAPMMLATLAMCITGLAVIVFARAGLRSNEIIADHKVVGRDLRAFFLVYVVAIAASFIPQLVGRFVPGLNESGVNRVSYIFKVLIAAFLVGAYVRYVLQTFRCEGGTCENHDTRPLHFHRKAETPRLRIVSLQVIAGLIALVAGAKLFVVAVGAISEPLGVSSLVLGIIITPIATELPEKFNSITWIRQRKDTLALGNITGAMVFQSSITPAIGILFTPWDLDKKAIASAVIAIAATVVAWGEMTWRKRLSPYSLLVGGLFYALYLIYVFWLARIW
ncbi:MAG: sodium:calcium antiporter [Armatimonadota bacterium]|nr:sodium:calcium antiporter [Armatimonadota bacterium]